MIFTFLPTPKNAGQAAFQARIMDRAINLLADDYTIVWGHVEFPGDDYMATRATVVSPDLKVYRVNFGTGEETCDCPCCEEHRFCKHLLGVLLEDERLRDEARVAEYEATGR